MQKKQKLTTDQFLDLIEKHGVSPYIGVIEGDPFVCIDGNIDVEMLVEELNKLLE